MNMNFSEKFLAKLKSKIYRTTYVAENVTLGIASQIRTMREQRDMSQIQLGTLMGKPQSVVSRLESVNYGKLTVQSLLDVAAAFDVALLVQFVAYPEFVRRTKDVSPDALNAPSFSPDQFITEDTSKVLISGAWNELVFTQHSEEAMALPGIGVSGSIFDVGPTKYNPPPTFKLAASEIVVYQ